MNFFFASALFVALMAAAGGSAWAQSNAAELKTYLQQLEVDKMQHKNNPARYQEYENKIASIKKELGMSATNSTTEPTKNDVATQAQETEQARMARTLSATDYDKWKLAQSPKKENVSPKQLEAAQKKAVQYPREKGQPINEELYMGVPAEYRSLSGAVRKTTYPIADSEKDAPVQSFELLANFLKKERGITSAIFDNTTKQFVVEHNVEFLTTDVQHLIQKIGNSEAFEKAYNALNLPTYSKSKSK